LPADVFVKGLQKYFDALISDFIHKLKSNKVIIFAFTIVS